MQSSSVRLLWSVCVIVQLLPTSITASSSGSYGGNSLMGGFGGGSGSGYGGSGAGEGKGPITAAVETHRSVEVKPVQMSSEPHEPQVIEVPSDDMPVTVHFKSQSSRVLVQQTHTPAQINEPEHTSSEDEPQRVIHEVVKPVIQEIREIIQPYRRLIQQIQPVIEQTHTVIAKGEPRPPVQPLSVPGASGSLSGVGAGASGGTGLSGVSAGSKSFGSSGNYAASASSISLKSAPSSSSESFRPLQSSSPSSSPSSQASNTNSGRKFASIQQIFQQSPASTYSARRGDFRDPQPSKTKMTLRPAPISPYTAYQRGNVQMAQTQTQLQPVYQPYAFSGYQGAISAFHEENLPLMTFVAKPHRFRARARA